jgi:hypothetical protein
MAVMTVSSERSITRLYRYSIASADMYYCEVNQRDVCVCVDPEKGLRIWGEIPGERAVTAVGLCQIFLEYAMYCQTWRDGSQAGCNMRGFGECLGAGLARYIQDNIPMEQTAKPGAYALKYVLESMNAHFTVEQAGSELRFIVDGCQLQATADHTGLREVDLAHQGISALCQSLIHVIDSDLVVHVPLDAHADHIFSVTTPVDA